jgi:hypothetical protein
VKRATIGLAVAVVHMLGGCGGRQTTSSSGVDSDDAIMYVRANVRDANVFVDGRFVGPINVLRGGIAVEAGKHRVEVRRDDYFSRYLELDLKRAERRKLEITLAPVLP